MAHETIFFRETARDEDVLAVREIISSTGFFSDEEMNVAIELLEDRLKKGEKSDYNFIFIDSSEKTVGYACYGRIPETKSRFDLYWIAMHKDYRKQGMGKILLKKVEEEICNRGGTRIYLDTSSRKQYEPTHKFYEKSGYTREAILNDFYHEGDGKIIFMKILNNKMTDSRTEFKAPSEELTTEQVATDQSADINFF